MGYEKRIRGRRLLKRICAILLLLLVLPITLAWMLMTQPTFSKNDASDTVVDAMRLKAHVVALAETYYPRGYVNRENLAACADYIAEQLKAAGARTSFQDYQAEGQTYRNVRGFLGPEGGPRIIVGAHYDACNMTPGADDNASGVAGLIELAHLLASTDLACEVELVAYCLEEPPFYRTPDMGSAQHARLMREERVDVRGMISLEMIGYFSDEKNSQNFPLPLMRLFYPSEATFIAVVGCMNQRDMVTRVKAGMKGATDLPVYSLNAPRIVPGVDLSDHMNYWDEGFKAVMITDTSFFRYEHYHGMEDTPDKLDYERMAKVVVGAHAAVERLCRDAAD